MEVWAASTSGRITPRVRASVPILYWVGPRADPDAVAKKKILSSPGWESNPGRPAHSLVRSDLYI